MTTLDSQPSTRIKPLVITWLGLVALTGLSIGLGEWLHGFASLPMLVAAIIWLKAWLVGRYFLETTLSRVLIRRLVATFIAFAPIALILTHLFGPQFAEWVKVSRLF